MSHESIAQLRAKVLLLYQQAMQLIARVPRKARVVIGMFLVASVFMAIYTAVSAKDCILHLKVQHGFRNAQVSVWVDGDLAYSGTITGSVKKKFGFLPSDTVQGSLSQMIPVRSGQHSVRVQVVPDDASSQEDSITGDFKHNQERELFVAARHSALALSWQGTSDAEPEMPSSSGWISRYAGSLLLSVAGSVVSALTGLVIKELPGRLRSGSNSSQKAGAGSQ